jgi:AraC-like DNA-binding protein
MSGHLLNNHCRLFTQDLDHSRDVMSRMWEHHEIRLNSGWTYSIRWHQVDLENTSLVYCDSPTSVYLASGPVGHTYRIGMHEEGRSRHRINGYETVLTPARAILNAPGQELDMETEPFRALMLTFDGAFVDKALTRRFGRLPPFEEWAREFSVESGPAACLSSLSHWMAGELDRQDTWLLASRPTAARLERALLGLFLDCLGQKRPEGRRRNDELATRQVQRVEEWIDAHLADPVTVDDLAEVAGIGVRSLQTAFRRLRGCTPMEALARRRLEAARDALRVGSPQTTVTQVAADCGIFHFGRFAFHYLRAFGETPSATLARAVSKHRA